MTQPDLDAIQDLVGYRFDDPHRLVRALTHASFAHEHGTRDYERLEFLGDSVVNLFATARLVARWPEEPEGVLTQLRQKVVSTTSLGRQGRSIGIDRHIRLGRGEAARGRVADSIVGDVVEAVFGAIFLEGGLDGCEAFADRVLDPLVEKAGRSGRGGADRAKNAINLLQEATQRDQGVTPVYRDVHGRSGALDDDGEPVFVVEVVVGDERMAEGEGRTKKAARLAAARCALAILDRRAGGA